MVEILTKLPENKNSNCGGVKTKCHAKTFIRTTCCSVNNVTLQKMNASLIAYASLFIVYIKSDLENLRGQLLT